MTKYVYKFKQGETDLIFSSLNKAKRYVKNVVMPRDTLKEWFTDDSMKTHWIIMYKYGEFGDSDLNVDIQKFKVH